MRNKFLYNLNFQKINMSDKKHFIKVKNLVKLFQEKIITKEQFLKELDNLKLNK